MVEYRPGERQTSPGHDLLSMKYRLTLGVVLVLVVALWKLWPWLTDNTVGTTTGIIIVSSPEVYSRERLVNDRFQEATWLDSELRDIDKLYWGATVLSSRNTQQVTMLQTSANQSNDKIKAPDVPSAQPDGAGKPPSHDPNATDSASRQTSVDGLAQSSPIERFRDRVAYREEVRTASLETQLDDRHDIAGNTLYRVKFSVTILPEQDTSAWALVYVELKGADDAGGADSQASRETYTRWLDYYEGQLNDELDRLSGHSTAAWHPDEFREFVTYVAGALRHLVCDDAPGDCDQLMALAAVSQARLEDQERTLAIQAQPCNQLDAPTAPSVARIQCDRIQRSYLDILCDSSSVFPETCPVHFDNYGRLEALLQGYRMVRYPNVPESGRPRPRQFFRQVIAEYLKAGLDPKKDPDPHDAQPLWDAELVGCEVGMCRIKLGELKGDAVKRFMNDLRADQVFAYAVSPKESVQRIANLASSQRARQLALSMSLASENVPLGTIAALLQQSEKDDSFLQAVLRKPLVVGFAPPGESSLSSRSDPHSISDGSQEPPRDDVATFGWIIGPRFDIADGGTPRFRHVASENDVSAIISVPSWWESAAVKVRTCWVDEREVRKILPAESGGDPYAQCKGKFREEVHSIRLPGQPTEIARKLGLDIVRRPSVFNEVRMTVEAGHPADILIEGNHLWRSTVVTLNGTPADNITVLPDMKGIVARFKEIAMPPPNRGLEELWVFTSEGSSLAGWITVVGHPPPIAASTLPAAAALAAK